MHEGPEKIADMPEEDDNIDPVQSEYDLKGFLSMDPHTRIRSSSYGISPSPRQTNSDM